MLTIKNNLNMFKSRQGKFYTQEELKLLCETFITSDISNFKKGFVGGGFTAAIADKIGAKLTIRKDGTILVINDLSLHMLNTLLSLGYKKENIYLAFGKWNSDGKISDNDTVYNIMKEYIKSNFNDTLNIIKLKEIFTMQIKFDAIIANPPYGKTGAKVTENIINNVEFGCYVNLEPIVDFLKFPAVYNHMQLADTEIIEGFGGDAHVLPSLFVFNKDTNNNLSSEDFFVYTVSNKLTKKYFTENIVKRTSYDAITFDEDTTVKNLDFSRRLIFGVKVCSNAVNHLDKSGLNVGGSAKSTPYKINKQELTLDDYYKIKKSKAFWGVILTFNSECERANAFAFSYSSDGFRFLNLLAHSMQRDNFHAKEYAALFPKVDWTRTWTVEEILEDYGYSAEEITAVMTDLKNFKGIERD